MRREPGGPVIGLVTYGRDERNRFTLYAQYVDAVRRAGGLPVLLPPGERHVERLLDLVGGLVLTGGGDLDPGRYGGNGHPKVYNVDSERDESELAWFRAACARRLPTLAVCRGMQLANVACGGTLFEHLEERPEVPHRAPPREPIRHEVTLDGASRLAALIGAEPFDPYSWHHQAIRELAPAFRAVAWAPDGVIEAIEDPDRPELVCVQWHPELGEPGERDGKLFDWLVDAAR